MSWTAGPKIQPDATGLWCVNATTGAEQKFTFQQLSGLSAQAANVFRSAGVSRGDRVLIMRMTAAARQ